MNKSSLFWLALAQMIGDKACVFCGFTWASRADVELRHPIAATAGGNDIACKPCWDEGKRL